MTHHDKVRLVLDWLYDGYENVVAKKNVEELLSLKQIEQLLFDAIKNKKQGKAKGEIAKWLSDENFQMDDERIALLKLRLEEKKDIKFR